MEGDKLRGSVDYGALNKITARKSAPIHKTDEIFDRIVQGWVFSKTDLKTLKTGFHQIRMKPLYIEKSAFSTKYGQFEYLVMPMAACIGPDIFQTLMSQIFDNCIKTFVMI